MRLLLVEDDSELGNGLASSLAQSNYVTDIARSASEALAAHTATPYGLMILDLGLPDMDGIDLLRRLRQRGTSCPVIVLTARDTLQDRIQGLDAGADDYLPKPFELGELEARIRALLRRGNVADTAVSFANLRFDSIAREITVQGKPVDLTARELSILELLLQKPGKIVSKQHLLESVYADANDTNLTVIEVLMSRLRKKLEDAGAGIGIRALRGLGYRLETHERQDP